jgi:O-antigen/teichoic acid export membrane protein
MSRLSVGRTCSCARLLQTRQHLRAIVRFRPYDTSTEEGRAQERLRRVGLSALASMAAKLVSVTASLVSVPLATSYLGVEQFGLWMTVLSLTGLLGMADLGIGNGIVSLVAEAHGRGDRIAARRLVSNAFFVLLGMGAFVASAVLALRTTVPWDRLLGFHSEVAGPAAVLALLFFGISLPLGLAQRVLAAYQEGFAAGLWQVAAGLLSLGSVVVAVITRSGVVGLVLAVSGAPVVVNLLNCLVLFLRQMPWLRPRLSDVDAPRTKTLLRMGSVFLCLQVAMAIGFNSDSLVLAHVVGGTAVAEYSVTSKLFSIPQMLLGYVLMPLWPAYGEAIAKGDIAWARQILRRSVIVSLAVMLVAAGVLVGIGQWLLVLWTGGKITVSLQLLVVFGIWSIVIALASPLAMFLNGAKVVGIQIVVSATSAAANIALSIFLTRSIGVSGVVLGSIISQVVLTLVPYCIYFPRLLNTIEARARVAKTARGVAP